MVVNPTVCACGASHNYDSARSNYALERAAECALSVLHRVLSLCAAGQSWYQQLADGGRAALQGGWGGAEQVPNTNIFMNNERTSNLSIQA